ncbi:NAD(P)-dependent dehydrogenase (short-subunit alcohol dehydrogenase family) [Chryseobacterium defluvii]|uniref:NAD(P)-dependent dehydrogenase (Short-subunit alcohol dehydrogenase family) n=1 Tax=Chryseobacterium defluvii TaxID=160396 RepID=A0A840K807_9FLAO|nr:SDR family oxidoreductase [Chryseobacterium defluvii]MBB4805389.1 NAD(P)-dependent dehydrogenase (short-subunit alcohol dehydrogenase family) [Chryseobacterium defluvii]
MNTIFMTGTSTGLGKAAVKLFAAKGWNVIATMRKPENETELNELPNVTLMALDVTDKEQVRRVISEVVSKYNVDVVFNNAGYGLAGPFEGADEDQIFRNINTNLLGVMRVTQAFLPHFREKGKGMFISTTSIGGSVTFPMNSVYHATKFALEGWSESLTYELEPFGITVKTVAPGGIATDFAGRSLDLCKHDAYEEIFSKVFNAFTNPERRAAYSSAEQIAEVVYEAATDRNQQLKYIAGNDAKELFELRNAAGQENFRKEVKKIFLEI